MYAITGIRHEDKYAMERRTPITPFHCRKLIEADGLHIVAQSSPKRVFSDEEYREAGARVQDDPGNCDVIFGVKEIPEEAFEEGKTYVFFQPCNQRPALQHAHAEKNDGKRMQPHRL